MNASALAAHRDSIVAALSRLVRRRERLRRELSILALAGFVGGLSTLLAPSESTGYIATHVLTFVAVMFAVRDWRRVRILNDQIALLARALTPLV